MNLSARIEYACIAVLDLAASYGSGEPVRIRKIAEQHNIPSRFLVQILLQLKSAGIVSSTRGAAGGYELVRDPNDISLRDVMSSVDAHAVRDISSAELASPATRALTEAWAEVAQIEQEMLASISFADLLARVKDETENMYYI